jgi:hypothetical protein
MKRILISAAALMLASGMAQAANDIPVDRVILSTSGLANFVHQMPVTGNAEVEFPVRFNQVDDILKSLVVYDKGGKLGGVTLPGKKPLDQVFKDLPFTKAQLANPMLLLNAYQGAQVSLKKDNNVMKGRLLQVVPETVVVDDVKVTKHRISIMVDGNIRQAVLEELTSVEFEDAKIRAEISRALEAIRENGTAERRMMKVALLGDGDRKVSLSYVVDAPLWKAAYRMVVPETGDDKKGLMQGWAVIENMTAGDWENVDMTLVSGNPVTFRQSLYESYYVDRPEIPVQVFGRVMPRMDDGSVATAEEAERGVAARRQRGEMMMKSKAMAPAMAPMEGFAMADMAVASSAPMPTDEMGGGYGGMDNVMQAANAAQSAEATTQVLFRFPSRFSLKAGESMMLPFVSRDVPMERLDLYQPETHPKHPLAAVEIKNDSETGLPPGILTIYEESKLLNGTSFVGDARVPVLAAGEKRMISYALDTKTTVDRADKSDSTEGKISISQGVIRAAMKTQMETTYTIKAPEKEARTVVIEHPKAGGDYKIISPDPKDVEVTDSHYRIRVSLKAGETKAVPVILESEGWNSYAIVDMDADGLLNYAASSKRLDDKTRKVFEKLAAQRREIDVIDQGLQQLEQERQNVFQDQERIRHNLESLSGKSEVQEKYLDKLNQQEDRIVKIDAEKKDLSQQRAKKWQQLQEMILAIEI